MQSRESESDSIWLCLEEVAQPGQPISFSQQTTQTQMSALSRDTARSHCTQDEGTWDGKAGRPGGWDATVLPTASGNVHALGLLCDFLGESVLGSIRLLFQTRRCSCQPGSTALCPPPGRCQLRKAGESQTSLLKRGALWVRGSPSFNPSRPQFPCSPAWHASPRPYLNTSWSPGIT